MRKVPDKPVQISERRSRHSFKVYDDPSDLATVPGRMRLWRFLQEFVDQPALLQCGPTFAQKMAIYHTGEGWVLTGEAEADDV